MYQGRKSSYKENLSVTILLNLKEPWKSKNTGWIATGHQNHEYFRYIATDLVALLDAYNK